MAREIEARLKISAVDRASATLLRVGATMDQINRHARAVSRQARADAIGDMRAQAQAQASAVGVMGLRGAGAAAAIYMAVNATKQAVIDFADLERQMNRVGVTAGASNEQITAGAEAIRDLSQKMAMPMEDTLAGFQALVAAGRTWEESMDFLPAVVLTAQAAGAQTADIAATADALAGSMKIAGSEMQLAFDKLVTGGKLGKFELKDMASYLPSILPQMAALGYTGQEGLERTIALLQAMRLNTGTSSEAATNLTNVLQKMYSEETIKNFKEHYNVDLPKALKKATDNGEDLVDAFVRLTREATGGDMEQLKKIFSDQQFSAGMLTLIQRADELKRILDGLGDAGGAAEQDAEKIINDTQAALDRLKGSADQASAAFGRLLVAGGAVSVIDTVTAGVEGLANSLERTAGLLERIHEIGLGETIEELSVEGAKSSDAGAVISKVYEATAGRPVNSGEVVDLLDRLDGNPVLGTDGGIAYGHSTLSDAEFLRKVEDAARLSAFEEAHMRRENAANATGDRWSAAQDVARVPVNPVEAQILAGSTVLPGSLGPLQADRFQGRLMRLGQNAPPSVRLSPEEIAEDFRQFANPARPAMAGPPLPRPDPRGPAGTLPLPRPELQAMQGEAETLRQKLEDAASPNLSGPLGAAISGARSILRGEIDGMVADAQAGMVRLQGILGQRMRGPTVTGVNVNPGASHDDIGTFNGAP